MTVHQIPPPAGWEEHDPSYMTGNGVPQSVQVTVSTFTDFAAVDEETAQPIMGDEETCLLSHGGMLVMYGDGGAGKTTMELDMLCHLAAGDPWLGLETHGTSRILIIENEGPRGMFRKKLRRKAAAWQGGEFGARIFVLEDPWALFTFDEELFRQELRLLIEQHEFDIVAAGPVNSLGIKGGGTPEEVSAFIYSVELVRQQVKRPTAMVFAHHENKAGDIAGAWEGRPDTLMHVSNQGNGSTRVHWQKVRWGPSLHGKTWQLSWADGEGFELNEEEVRSDSEIEADLMTFVSENPGCSWRQILENVEGRTDRMTAIRNALFTSSKLENRGAGNKMALWAHISAFPAFPASGKQGSGHAGNVLPVKPEDECFPVSPLKGETLFRETVSDGNEWDDQDHDSDIPF
jgi:hypothetical protein